MELEYKLMLKRATTNLKKYKFFDGVNLSIFAVIFVVIGGYIVLKSLAATPPAVYLTPASSAVNTGTDFTVQIMEDSGTVPVNAVQANLTYPTNLLDVVSIDTSGSAFTTVAESTSSNGNIRIGAGVATGAAGKTSEQLVATIHFKSKSAAGTAEVKFVAGTELVESVNNSLILGGLGNTTGGTYTINANAPSAPSGHIYLTPATSTVSTNAGFNVEIRENSGSTAVNAVQANLTYPASSLDVTGISTSSGAFSTVAEASASNGNIKIGLGTGAGTAAKIGDQSVAVIQFKAKTATGIAKVDFASGSAIIDASTNNDILSSLTNASGGSYTINAVSTPRSGGSGKQPTAPPAAKPSNATGANTTTTNTSATSVAPTGTYESTQLSEATTDTYSVEDESTVEEGQTVTIKVVNTKGKPLSSKSVTLDGVTKKTDKNGLAVFTGVLAGKQQVKIKGNSKSFTINVSASAAGVDSSEAQEFTLKVTDGVPVWKYVAGGLAALVLISLIVLLTNRGPRGPSGTIKPQAVDPEMEKKAVVMQNQDKR